MIPDDAIVYVPGRGEMTAGEIRKQVTERVITTSQASSYFGYSPDTWRRWAAEIHGAYQDAERGNWRLPYRSCILHLETIKRRGRRAKAKSAQTGRPGAARVQAGTLLRGRLASLGLR